jgi:Smg protein
MKNNVLQLISYLFNSYKKLDNFALEQLNENVTKLNEIGFDRNTVMQALAWLSNLIKLQTTKINFATENSLRVYSQDEIEKINTECRDYIFLLEQIKILSPKTREIIIDQLLLLNQTITLTEVKIVVLLVLTSQNTSKDNTELKRYSLMIIADNKTVQ